MKKDDDDSASSGSSSCPVMKDSSSSSSSTASSSWWRKFTTSSASSPTTTTSQPQPQSQQQQHLNEPSSCPMLDDQQRIGTSTSSTPTSEQVASLEEAAKYAQTPQPDQRFPLRTDRQVSSIPRGSAATAVSTTAEESTMKLPHHQANTTNTITDKNNKKKNNNNNWVYPSEQQLYNAMRRKGWNNVPEDSIPTVLQIHNSINERTWDKVLEWENMNNSSNSGGHDVVHGGFDQNNNRGANNESSIGTDTVVSATALQPPPPRLVRFVGRPKDMTPKAYIFSTLGLFEKPFDRHDWYVESYPSPNNTRVQRYVIDYYLTEQQRDAFLVPIPYVDARPAVDSPRAVWMRAQRLLQDAFPGITSYYWRRQRQQQHQQQLDQQQQQQQRQSPHN